MPWIQLSLDCTSEHNDFLEEALLALGAVSVTYQDAADQPVLEPGVGETPLWQNIKLSALFDADLDASDLKKTFVQKISLVRTSSTQTSLAQSTSNNDVKIEILEDKDWEREWMQSYRAMPFGERLWICPSWQAPPEPNAVNLLLDPGMAFGTGTHPTTAMCLQWLDKAASTGLDNKTVLDFGCGSGILAIAALLLGAESATGVDNDPQALLAAKENALRNGCEQRFTVLSAEQREQDCLQAGQTPCFDLVVANILAGPLLSLSSVLSEAVANGGDLLLSGLLVEQAETVMNAYRSEFQFQAPQTQDGWICLHGVKTSC